MTPQELKNSILQRAIEGRLAEQRAEEGTGAELFDKIQKEKKKLEKEEILFEIPESWIWVNLEDLCYLIGGYAFKSTEYLETGVRVIRISDFNESGLLDTDKKFYKEDDALSKYLIESNDILMCMTGGTVGKIAFLGEIKEKLYLNQRVAAIRVNNKYIIDKDYLHYVISSKYIKNIIATEKNSTNDNISMKLIQQFPIPLPPLAEQKRIVEKIEELMPLVDEYEENWQKLEEFNQRFPEDMKKSLLQEAIKGKLVEQRKEEGTGTELFGKIQKEKKELIKEGKIKKQKPLPEITEDEIPFEIPETWKWVRLGEIIELTSGQDFPPSKYNEEEKGIPYITGASNIIDEKIIINRWTESASTIVYEGDLLITCKGTIGKVAVLEIERAHIARQIMGIKPFEGINKKYLKFYLNNLSIELIKSAKSMIPGINRNDILFSKFPLPPLAEQKRIVDRLEELLPLCDKLIKNKEK